MIADDGKGNLVDNDELKSTNDKSEDSGLLNNMKKRCGFEINGLFYIILATVILALALTLGMVLSIFFGPPQIKPHAGISTPIEECTDLGLDICRKGGSGIDAMIGSFFCVTTLMPGKAGIGGCGSMLVHNHTTGKSAVFDMSCKASDTFSGKINDAKSSVAIPGILSGFQKAHAQYGRMSWNKIMDMTIKKLSEGVKVTSDIRQHFESTKFSKLSVNFTNLYKTQPKSGTYKLTDEMKTFLTNLKKEGVKSGITGTIANEMVAFGIGKAGKFDSVRVQKPIQALFRDYVMIAPPLPAKGSIQIMLAYEMMNILVPKSKLKKEDAEFYHLLLECMKISQAVTSFLGDNMPGIEETLMNNVTITKLTKFVNTKQSQPASYYAPYLKHDNLAIDSGIHISVVDPWSFYVSFSANLGSEFGSGLATKSGILLNDAMRLFTLNTTGSLVSGNNWSSLLSGTYASIFTDYSKNKPAKSAHPLHYLTPVAVMNMKRKCGVRFTLGADSGARSPTGVLQMILGAIYLDQTFCPTKDCMDLEKAGNRPRIHTNQLTTSGDANSTRVIYDNTFSETIKQQLTSKYGHTNLEIEKPNQNIQNIFSIGKVQYEIKGHADGKGDFELF